MKVRKASPEKASKEEVTAYYDKLREHMRLTAQLAKILAQKDKASTSRRLAPGDAAGQAGNCGTIGEGN
jgi:hypothetical protein